MRIKELTAGKSPWEIVFLAVLTLAVLFSQISVSIVQSFLALTLAAWIILLVRKERRFAVPAFFWPLLVYAALSLLASAFSVNPGVSFRDDRELLLFIIVPIVFTAFKKAEEADLIAASILASGFINVLYSIGYGFIKAVPGERVEGFMSHYMTQAGLLVLFGSVALGYIFFGRGRNPLLWAGSLVLAFYALILTLTRSGWIGLGVALRRHRSSLEAEDDRSPARPGRPSFLRRPAADPGPGLERFRHQRPSEPDPDRVRPGRSEDHR